MISFFFQPPHTLGCARHYPKHCWDCTGQTDPVLPSGSLIMDFKVKLYSPPHPFSSNLTESRLTLLFLVTTQTHMPMKLAALFHDPQNGCPPYSSILRGFPGCKTCSAKSRTSRQTRLSWSPFFKMKHHLIKKESRSRNSKQFLTWTTLQLTQA